MSDPLHAWMDVDEVRRLAESLMAPPAGHLPGVEVDFGDEFVGFAGPAVERGEPVAEESLSSTARPGRTEAAAVAVGALARASARAQQGGLIRAAAPEQTPPPTAPEPESATPQAAAVGEGHGPLLKRLEGFRDWMRSEFQAQGIFLIDGDGQAIFDEGGKEKVVRLARNLAHALRRAGREQVAGAVGNVRIKLGQNASLEVIPLDTSDERIVLAAMVPSAIAPDQIGRILRELAEALELDRAE